MRKDEFKNGIFKPIQINDSRFGVRRLFLNAQERPRVFSYKNPGRAYWGNR